MKERFILSVVVFLFIAGSPRAQTGAGDSVPAGAVSLRDGQTLEFTGFPISPEYTGGRATGVLRFSAATKDMTLPCYQEGTNTGLLEEIQRKLESVVAWNGRNMLRGKDPAAISVTGTYDARAGALVVSEIEIPRVGEAAEGESFAYDRYRPDRGDAASRRTAPGRLPPQDSGVLPLPEENALPPSTLEGDGLPPAEAGVGTEPESNQPWRDYPSVSYQDPYTYHVEIPPSVGYSQDSVYYNSSYGAWGVRSQDGFQYTYPAAIPLHDSSGGAEVSPEPGSGENPGNEGSESGETVNDDGRKPYVGTPLNLPDTGSDSMKKPTGRAERWGRGRQINRKFTHPGGSR